MAKATLIKFYNTGCAPCNQLTEELTGINFEELNVNFKEVNAENDPDTAFKYGIMSVPALVFVVNDEPVRTLRGVLPKEAVIETIQEVTA